MKRTFARIAVDSEDVTSLFRRFNATRSGATAVEYALLAGGVALSIIAGLALMGDAAVDLLTIPTEIFSGAGG